MSRESPMRPAEAVAKPAEAVAKPAEPVTTCTEPVACGPLGDRAAPLSASEVRQLEGGRLISTVRRNPAAVEVKALFRCAPQRIMEMLTDYPSMPRHISGLESADVVARDREGVTVRFSMRFPFPLGRFQWTNHIRMGTHGAHSLQWTLVGGDLRRNDGRLLLSSYRDRPGETLARYAVSVETSTALPTSAERLVTRALLPRMVDRLRCAAEQR